MKHTDPWARLASHARRAPAPEAALPPGFATRVAARALAEPAAPDFLSLFGLKALGLAAALAAAALLAGYPALSGSWGTASDEDPVGELVSAI